MVSPATLGIEEFKHHPLNPSTRSSLVALQHSSIHRSCPRSLKALCLLTATLILWLTAQQCINSSEVLVTGQNSHNATECSGVKPVCEIRPVWCYRHACCRRLSAQPVLHVKSSLFACSTSSLTNSRWMILTETQRNSAVFSFIGVTTEGRITTKMVTPAPTTPAPTTPAPGIEMSYKQTIQISLHI